MVTFTVANYSLNLDLLTVTLAFGSLNKDYYCTE